MSTNYGTAAQPAWLQERLTERWLPSWALWGQPWAIVTAYNPHGAATNAASNHAAQAALQGDLTQLAVTDWARRGLSWQAGVNGAGAWREESCIVQGLPLRSAILLGQRYQQAAVLWGIGQRAALVWCAAPASQAPLERRWLTGALPQPAILGGA